MITQSELKKLLHYNPDSGIFTWLVSRRGTAKAGTVAGFINCGGYLIISVKGKQYKAHRLAFLYMEGDIPVQVDHKNHVKNDNSWNNLRAASYKINTKNRSLSSNNKSGFNGVAWNKPTKKWRVRIQVNGKYIYLGIFINIEDAISARKQANKKYNFHANHGKSSLTIK